MSVVRRIKESLGLVKPPNTYRCRDCGTTFESPMDKDSHWLTCDSCDSRELERVEG